MKMKVNGSKVIDISAGRARLTSPIAHSRGAQNLRITRKVGVSQLASNQRTSTPLIDIVNPQPKAFFAYLRVATPTKKRKQPSSSKRISRGRKGTK